MATILKSAYAFYNRQYQARPILTICTTNAILAGISDTLTQKYLAPSVSTSVSTSKSTSTSTSTSHSDHTDDSSSLIKEILQNAQDRSKEAMHKLAQDVEISWHEPKDKDGHSQGKIKADAEQAVGQAFIKVGQEMIEKSKQAENHDIIPDSTVVSIQATNSMDYPRMGRFMLYNFSVAPLIHTWYTILDKNFPIVTDSTKINSAKTSMLTRSMVPALKRVTADQVAFAPIGLALLFSGLTVLEGGGIQDIKNKLSNVRSLFGVTI
ncbi:hypothetical protein BGZ46_001962 [Entomortierella lignicola]|nr:hypothetical protein BGZ46_001962 [Entomortierella lignicola]